MSICSVVVHTKPEATLKVSATIEGMPHCEVMGAESGRIVVVIDVRNRQKVAEPPAENVPCADGGSCGV